ncbi:MAG TPA: hypothetical protein VFJ21_01030 [Mycobacteriales bacterium]|nr:hypothetical protein [Mycobacteriales bacterium]
MLQYTVSGVDTDTVRIVLADADQVTTNPDNGVVTFKGTNPGGTGNTATLASTNTATITVVNGNVGPAADNTEANGSDGTVTFSVKTATGNFVPVVYSEADGNQSLSLNADGTPKESFGVAQETDIVGAEPATGAITGPQTVSTVNKAADFFETNTDAVSYYYDSNDVFQVRNGSTGAYTTVTMAQFENALSVGDTLDGLFYNDTPSGQSTFQLSDTSPAAPASVSATPNTTKGGVAVTFPESDTGSVASYNVYRATATQPTITGGSVTCPATTGDAYSKVGSVTDDNTGPYTFNDTTAPATPTGSTTGPEYCYYVTSVDQGGEESAPSTASNHTTSAAAPTANGAPEFKSGSVSAAADTTVKVVYSENVDAGTVDNGDFKVTFTPAGQSTTYRGTVTAHSVTADTVTLTVDWTGTGAPTPTTGDTFIVYAQTGTDSNTVGDTDTPQQFQSASDAVQLVEGP